MCAVSYVGDYWKDRLPNTHPWVQPWISPVAPNWPSTPTDSTKINWPDINKARVVTHPTKEEFDALKKEVEELRKLLIAAKEYDEKTGQPDCELESKIELIRKVAELVGVSMEDVFGKKSNNLSDLYPSVSSATAINGINVK